MGPINLKTVMAFFILVFTFLTIIPYVNAISYSCPYVTKQFLQALYNERNNSSVHSQYFLGSWSNRQKDTIIVNTLNNFPPLGLTLTRDSYNEALCMYGSDAGSFFVLNCPTLRPNDIKRIYNKEVNYISFDGESQQQVGAILDKPAGSVQSVTFFYNTYQGTPNSCLYNIAYKLPNSPVTYLWVTAILSPQI